jgi:hypothetical protein
MPAVAGRPVAPPDLTTVRTTVHKDNSQYIASPDRPVSNSESGRFARPAYAMAISGFTVHVLLRREGWSINQKKTRRVNRGADVVEVLDGIRRNGRLPRVIRVDQGTEFVSRDLGLWASRSTSPDRASRPTMPSSRHSMAGSAQNA